MLILNDFAYVGQILQLRISLLFFNNLEFWTQGKQRQVIFTSSVQILNKHANFFYKIVALNPKQAATWNVQPL